jgi:hypothetical protein
MCAYEPNQPRAAKSANYIVYLLDGSGRICRSEWIAAEDDEEALVIARSLRIRNSCEIWQRDRRVGRVG